MMKIDEYVPGQFMMLSHHKDEQLPEQSYWVPALLLIASVFCFYFAGNFLVFGIALLVFAVITFWGGRPNKVIIFLEADIVNDSLVLAIRQPNKKLINHNLQRQKVISFSFSHERQKFSESDIAQEKGKDLRIQAKFETKDSEVLEGILWLQGVDTRDEILDLGKRLAQILGFDAGNIEKNDPKSLHLKFHQDSPQNIENPVVLSEVNEVGNLAEAYGQDNVRKDERLDKVICEEWDSTKHSFVGKVVEYAPKKKLEIEHRRSKAEIILYFFLYPLILVVGSLLVMAFLGVMGVKTIGSYLAPVLIGSGIISLIFAALHSSLKLSSGYFVPVNWHFDLEDKVLKLSALEKDNSYDLREITEVALYRVKTMHTESTGSGKNRRTRTYYRYNGITVLEGMSKRPFLVVGETGALREDPNKAYSDGLCFANIFCKLLELPLKFKDVSGQSDAFSGDGYYQIDDTI